MDALILDHVLIGARDLAATRDTYHRLGFKITPEGKHPGRGTSNRLVVFGPEYLEMLAIHDRTGKLFRPNLAPFLDEREGLFIFSMGTTELESRVADMRAKDAVITGPIAGGRHPDDGSAAYSWTQAEIDPKETPGSQTFFIQHNHTVEERYTDPPDPTTHPNGVTGIHSLTLAAKDARKAADRWIHLFGLDEVGEVDDDSSTGVRLAFSNAYLDFVEPTSDGALSTHLAQYGEGPYELAFTVGSLSDTGDYLASNGVIAERHDDHLGDVLLVAAEAALGVPMKFIEE